MQCSSCGFMLSDNADSCNFCGTHIEVIPPDATEHDSNPEETESTSQSSSESANEKKEDAPLTRAERVQVCVEKILRSNDLPAFSHHVHNLVSLMGKEDASMRRLTNVILSDHSLSIEVMRTANSMYYNRSGKGICSVTHAVAMMGVDAIYHLASGMRFLEHYALKSDRLTELLLLSTLTASHTRHLAKKFFNSQSEEASLCGLLKNLGEVLIACYMPNEYMQILAKMKQHSWTANEACISVMGFSYGELGRAVAQHWKLPESILEIMDETRDSESPKELSFRTLVSFSHALTNIVYRKGASVSTPQHVRALFEKYKRALQLDHRQASQILEAGMKDTKDTFSAMKVPLDSLRLERQMDLALERVKEDTKTVIPIRKPEISPIDLIQQLADEIESTLSADPNFGVSQIILMSLEAIFRGGPFDRVLLCLLTPDRKVIRGRLGLGNEIEWVANLVSMQLRDSEEPLIKVLLSGQDVFVLPNMMKPFLKSKVIRVLTPDCFGLFPIIVKDILLGAIYFDRIDPGKPVPDKMLHIISRLREITSRAIERSHERKREASVENTSSSEEMRSQIP
jgi:HD-like signal output (HDOD) protein